MPFSVYRPRPPTQQNVWAVGKRVMSHSLPLSASLGDGHARAPLPSCGVEQGTRSRGRARLWLSDLCTWTFEADLDLCLTFFTLCGATPLQGAWGWS